MAEREQTKIYHGDSDSTTSDKIINNLPILTRCQGNFLENVPLAFILLIIAELNGGNKKTLNYVMGTLLASRIAHAELGLKVEEKWGTNGVGRPVGYFGSVGSVLVLGAYAGWLIKGYWGI